MLATLAPDFESFDGDEMLLLLVCSALSTFAIVYWARMLRPISKLGAARFHRTPIHVAVLTGLLVQGFVVGRWADQQVRDNSGYVLLVFVMGGACLTIAVAIMPWLGISLRDDAYEQRNFAAVLALSGTILGVMITYAFANVGNGPSFWNNVYSSFLATGALLLLFFIVAGAGGAASAITEERDLASGLRFGALLLAASLVFGRAVAGDWESTAATTRDFLRDGWPAFLLGVAGVIAERMFRPQVDSIKPGVVTHGLIPSAAYLLYAVLWCLRLGWWERGGW